MITVKENIIDIFNAFHDGDIDFLQKENTNLVWTIDCGFLAEIINPNFKLFKLKIYNCRFLEFIPWMNPVELPQETWRTETDIFKTTLEILSAETKDNKIKIICSQYDSDYNFCGGELFLDCEGIEIFDQEMNKIDEESFEKIYATYWNSHKIK